MYYLCLFLFFVFFFFWWEIKSIIIIIIFIIIISDDCIFPVIYFHFYLQLFFPSFFFSLTFDWISEETSFYHWCHKMSLTYCKNVTRSKKC
jgi:hypothetical protein